MSKKEEFKYLIKEFQETTLPEVFDRDIKIPFTTNKIITVYGPRRSGKSFLFYSMIKKLAGQGIPKDRIVYLNFEDDRILPLDFKELGSLLEAFYELYPENKGEEVYLFFDEIQNIKNWENFVRRVYDREKAKIFITGSSSRLLSKEIATSLRGRTLSYPLYPLSYKEFLKFKRMHLEKGFEYSSQRFKVKKYLEEYLQFGGFPEVVLEDNIALKRKILGEYFKFLVYRDLSERFSLENTELLFDLLKFLLTNITARFSVNSYFNTIKQSISVSRDTVSSYLSFIQETEHIFFCPQFSYSLKSQRFNPKKAVCIDNGLRNVAAFKFSEDKGRLAENLVGSTYKKKEKELFYWKNKGEVDFVIRNDRRLTGINVTYTDRIEKREINSLLEFRGKFPEVKRLVLITRDTEKKENGIDFVPLWKWLLESKDVND